MSDISPWTTNRYYGAHYDKTSGGRFKAVVSKKSLGYFNLELEAAVVAWTEMNKEQKQRALEIGQPNPMIAYKEEGFLEVPDSDEDEVELETLPDGEELAYTMMREANELKMHALYQSLFRTCKSLIKERFRGQLQYMSESSKTEDANLASGDMFISVPRKAIKEQAMSPHEPWHLPLVEWMLTGFDNRRFRDLFFEVVDKAESFLVLSFFVFNDKRLWYKLLSKANENSSISIAVTRCPVGSKKLLETHGSEMTKLGRHDNLTLGLYQVGDAIAHDKLIMSEKEAWYGSCNASVQALSCSQFNIMLGYSKDTPQFKALYERATLFKDRLKELSQDVRNEIGGEYKEKRKGWWSKAGLLTFNDVAFDSLHRDAPSTSLTLKEINELKENDCLIVVSMVVSGKSVMKTIMEAAERGVLFF